MTEKELSNVLREIGRAQGMCNEYYEKWFEDTDMEQMLDMFKSGQDFCIEHDYPSLEFIRKNFDRGVLASHGIYVDEKLDLDITQSGIYIFLGKCNGRVHFREWCAADVYLRHDSDIEIESSDMAKVYINLYENSNIRGRLVNGYSARLYDHRKKKEG